MFKLCLTSAQGPAKAEQHAADDGIATYSFEVYQPSRSALAAKVAASNVKRVIERISSSGILPVFTVDKDLV